MVRQALESNVKLDYGMVRVAYSLKDEEYWLTLELDDDVTVTLSKAQLRELRDDLSALVAADEKSDRTGG